MARQLLQTVTYVFAISRTRVRRWMANEVGRAEWMLGNWPKQRCFLKYSTKKQRQSINYWLKATTRDSRPRISMLFSTFIFNKQISVCNTSFNYNEFRKYRLEYPDHQRKTDLSYALSWFESYDVVSYCYITPYPDGMGGAGALVVWA